MPAPDRGRRRVAAEAAVEIAEDVDRVGLRCSDPKGGAAGDQIGAHRRVEPDVIERGWHGAATSENIDL